MRWKECGHECNKPAASPNDEEHCFASPVANISLRDFEDLEEIKFEFLDSRRY